MTGVYRLAFSLVLSIVICFSALQGAEAQEIILSGGNEPFIIMRQSDDQRRSRQQNLQSIPLTNGQIESREGQIGGPVANMDFTPPGRGESRVMPQLYLNPEQGRNAQRRPVNNAVQYRTRSHSAPNRGQASAQRSQPKPRFHPQRAASRSVLDMN